MVYNEEQLTGFFEAVESLKKYRRADLTDDKGRSLLKELYTDLLPNDYILKKSLRENTTFLIGRKGTGKSTIFLRLEQELRGMNGYLPCYLDVKTLYESSQNGLLGSKNLENIFDSEALNKYLIERAFIQTILTRIIDEVSNKFNSTSNKILQALGISKVDEVKERLSELRSNIKDNHYIEKIELPLLQTIMSKETTSHEENKYEKFSSESIKVNAEMSLEGASGRFEIGGKDKGSKITLDTEKYDDIFSNIFLKVFQVQEIITIMKDTLAALNIRHLYVLLDDFSEIDDSSIKTFVDVVLAPLNNWSDEFIKFKVAAYPNRIYYGKIDPGKVDTIELDFYNLYSGFDRNKMEINAIGFTEKILEKRFLKFTNGSPEVFFDTSTNSIEDYYEILFNASMNVPRILGYILSYCYQSRVIYNYKIGKRDIELAAQRYYEDKIDSFFKTTTHSLISMNEKITALQLKNLLNLLIINSKEIKKRISTKNLKGSLYISTEPFSSHFHFDPRYEDFIKTLELNYFISKYSDIVDKDGNQASIYSLNYGLCVKNNIIWGKPKGSKYSKYFTQRPFNYNKLIKEFLSTSERIICTNPDCQKQFDVEEMKFLEFSNFKCNVCSSKVIIETLDDDIREVIAKIDKTKMLPVPEVKILKELQNSENDLYARDLAQEIDYSGQLIGWRGKKLEEKYKLVKRTKETGKPYKYGLTKEGSDFFIDWDN